MYRVKSVGPYMPSNPLFVSYTCLRPRCPRKSTGGYRDPRSWGNCTKRYTVTISRILYENGQRCQPEWYYLWEVKSQDSVHKSQLLKSNRDDAGSWTCQLDQPNRPCRTADLKARGSRQRAGHTVDTGSSPLPLTASQRCGLGQRDRSFALVPHLDVQCISPCSSLPATCTSLSLLYTSISLL